MWQEQKPMYLLSGDNLESLLRSIISEEIERISTKLNREIKMLTRDEAALKLSVCPNTISEWVKTGRLKNRGLNRKILILDSDLDGLESRRYTNYRKAS
jgi:hypothetical protein